MRATILVGQVVETTRSFSSTDLRRICAEVTVVTLGGADGLDVTSQGSIDEVLWTDLGTTSMLGEGTSALIVTEYPMPATRFLLKANATPGWTGGILCHLDIAEVTEPALIPAAPADIRKFQAGLQEKYRIAPDRFMSILAELFQADRERA